jgi:hypothetical protein
MKEISTWIVFSVSILTIVGCTDVEKAALQLGVNPNHPIIAQSSNPKLSEPLPATPPPTPPPPVAPARSAVSDGLVDPYVSEVARAAADHYAQQRKSFLDFVHVIYFAIGCKAINGGLVQPLIGRRWDYLLREGGVSDRELHKALTEAERDGLAKATQAGACDYWHQHPDAVYRLREAAQVAIY